VLLIDLCWSGWWWTWWRNIWRWWCVICEVQWWWNPLSEMIERGGYGFCYMEMTSVIVVLINPMYNE